MGDGGDGEGRHKKEQGRGWGLKGEMNMGRDKNEQGNRKANGSEKNLIKLTPGICFKFYT